MSILNVYVNDVGHEGETPRIVRIETNDTKATVVSTGYLNDLVKKQNFKFNTDDIVTVSTRESASANPEAGWYDIAHSSGNWSLTPSSEPGEVVLPTQANHFSYFNDTSGTLTDANGVAVTHNGTILAYNDNASSFRLKGPSSPDDPSAGADVQSYSGIFYNAGYDTFGTLKTRASFGANVEMDMAIQSPHALLLIAEDGSQTDGVVKCASQTQVQFHTRYAAEQVGICYSYFDRVDTGDTGDDNTSQVTLSTNANHLHFQSGATTQAIVLPTVASGSVAALEAGVFFYDTGTNKLMFYNGSALETVTSTT